MEEVQEACTFIQEAAHDDANIIWGAVFDDELDEEIRITVIATGIKDKPETKLRPVKPRESVKTHERVRDVEAPAVVRKVKKVQQAVGFSSHHVESENDFIFDEDLYDQPTFLRKQAD
jgi:cell division protein FtsZ